MIVSRLYQNSLMNKFKSLLKYWVILFYCKKVKLLSSIVQDLYHICLTFQWKIYEICWYIVLCPVHVYIHVPMQKGKNVKTMDGFNQIFIAVCTRVPPQHHNFFCRGNLFTVYLWLLEPWKNRACGTTSTFKKFVNVISCWNYFKTMFQRKVTWATFIKLSL